MPVRWIYVLKDGTLTVPSQGTGTKPTWPVTTDGKMPTKDNPIVGRIAMWADDDTSKVNINTAAGFVNTPDQVPADYKVDPNAYFGSYWDTPRFMTVFDHGLPDNLGMPKTGGPNGGLALTQLLQGEYQRYPGHPATTSLGGIFGAYMSSQDLWQILPRISTANYSGVASANATASTFVDKFSYGTNGGTQRVKVGPAGAGAGSDNQNLLPKTERLYASVDELLFATNAGNTAGQDPTQPGYMRQSNDAHIDTLTPSKLTPDHLDRLRFFLTANSRAPELNLFGRPRVTIWPVRVGTRDRDHRQQLKLTTTQDPNITAGASIHYYPVTPDGGTGLNPYDKVMLFCSTIGSYNNTVGVRDSDQAPGSTSLQLPYRYIFFRRNPYLAMDITAAPPIWPTAPTLALEDQLADITLPRNRFLLETYLSQLTSQPIPGFGASLKSKWDADGNLNRDQILAEIFDYCRCANAQDGTTIQFTPTVQPNRYFAPRGLMAPSKIQFQNPPNAPGVPDQGRSGTAYSTGLGRFPTVYEATLDFYYAGPTWLKETATGKLVAEKIETLTDPYAHRPKYRQLRAFLLLSTFNPMFGYAPMATPSAPAGGTTTGTTASIEPRISFEVTGLDQFKISTGVRSRPRFRLVFPTTDANGCKPNTIVYQPSGSAWNGRNMGGFEGFMHTLLGGVNNQGVSIAKIRRKDEAYSTYSNAATALPSQFFGGTPPGGGTGNALVNAANQEYYGLQTQLSPYTATNIAPGYKAYTTETGVLIPTADVTFNFYGNTSANPVVVKVWYDNYNPAGHPVNPRPATIAGKPYNPCHDDQSGLPFEHFELACADGRRPQSAEALERGGQPGRECRL